MKPLELNGGSALVIVAHPDDETIWMGGTILSFPKIHWTVVSLCRSTDKDRAPKFRNICRFYKARGIISDLEDEGVMNIRESIPGITRRLRQLRNARFDYLFTHAYNGEYGHPRHKGVHRAVKQLFFARKLAADYFFTFAYHPSGSGMSALEDRDAEYHAKLSRAAFDTKRRIIHELYGFDTSSFEYRSSRPKETFNRVKFS